VTRSIALNGVPVPPPATGDVFVADYAYESTGYAVSMLIQDWLNAHARYDESARGWLIPSDDAKEWRSMLRTLEITGVR
jgi:hypothetical protein